MSGDVIYDSENLIKNGKNNDNYEIKQDGEILSYNNSKCRDPIFAILWIGQLVAFFTFGIMGLSKFNKSEFDKNLKEVDGTLTADELTEGSVIIMITGLVGLLTSIFIISLLRKKSTKVIKICINITLIMVGLFCIVMLALGSPVVALIGIIYLAILALYFACVRRRIPLASATIETGLDGLKEYNGPFYVSILLTLMMLVWVVLWVLCSVGITTRYNKFRGAGALCLLSLFWTVIVISNIGHVTTAGVVSAWWFKSDQERVTWKALKRASTTSLGSIAFGSLIVSLIETLRVFLRRDDDGCADCILGCIEDLIAYFNSYAYIYCAMYGTTFLQSGRQVWNLIKSSRVIDAIINDDLSGIVLATLVVAAGLVTAIVAAILSFIYGVKTDILIIFTIIGFLVGFCITMVATKVIRSAIQTVFVCYCDDPNAGQRNRPQSYAKLNAAAKKIYGGYDNL